MKKQSVSFVTVTKQHAYDRITVSEMGYAVTMPAVSSVIIFSCRWR